MTSAAKGGGEVSQFLIFFWQGVRGVWGFLCSKIFESQPRTFYCPQAGAPWNFEKVILSYYLGNFWPKTQKKTVLKKILFSGLSICGCSLIEVGQSDLFSLYQNLLYLEYLFKLQTKLLTQKGVQICSRQCRVLTNGLLRKYVKRSHNLIVRAT